MQLCIGTKLVRLKPMTRRDYNDFRGFKHPPHENGDDEGYLVEYVDGGKPNTEQYAGYVSWSPKAQADAAYRPTTGLPFGLALEALRKGKCARRADWPGITDLFLINGCNKLASAMGYGFGEYVGEPTFQDAIFMRTADNKLTPWTPTQADMLADDWVVAE